ncbi:hypothetical protein F7725_003891, partial [Dissostichus mawsoni]
NPVQEWGEEFEDGAIYGITLRREPVPSSPNPGEEGPCCAFVQYRTCKVRRLKAATMDLLVNQILDPENQEQDYSRIFLSTYRTFINNAASDLDNSECYNSPLLAFVQTWLDEYSEDFRDSPLHPALRLLLDHLRISSAVHHNMRSQPNFSSLAGQTEALLKTFQNEEADKDVSSADEEQDEEASGDEDSGCENSPDQGGFMEFSTAAIADQLTRMDSALFVKVVPYQCLGCVWSQRDKKENMSPTIRATIAQFNAVTNRVILSLLCQPTDANFSPTSSNGPQTSPAQRARIIEKWIRVAQDCRQLKNFSSLKAILSALQSNAVYRLRKTWAAVNRDSMATFDNLWETFPDENCVLTNRELLLESTSSGVVPYLGTYLTVLTMLDTALLDTVEGGLINFEKRRRLEPPLDLCSPTSWRHRTLTKKLSSLLTVSDGSKKVPADQISVSSSGSSGSEMEDLSCPNSTCSIGLQSFHGSCTNVSEAFSSSSSLSSPCSSAASSPDSSTPSSSSSSSPCGTGARPKPPPSSQHKRSVSMTSLPLYNRQVADSCIVRVSVELGRSNGNMYKSILLTSQDKTAQVIQRALEKHHLELMDWQDFTLTQLISSERELLIPDKANVFYAMSTTANFDFILRQYPKGQKKPLRATCSLGRNT